MGAVLLETEADVAVDAVPPSPEGVVRAAALACFARWGITKTTLDDVAREAGISRATLYRRFPGGKNVLITEVLAHEFARFGTIVRRAVAEAADLESLLVSGFGAAVRFLREHAALTAVVEFEPQLILPWCAFRRSEPLLAASEALVAPLLVPHLPIGADAGAAARHLTRAVLSYATDPSPFVDLDDEASVRRLVRFHLLPSILPLPKEDHD